MRPPSSERSTETSVASPSASEARQRTVVVLPTPSRVPRRGDRIAARGAAGLADRVATTAPPASTSSTRATPCGATLAVSSGTPASAAPACVLVVWVSGAVVSTCPAPSRVTSEKPDGVPPGAANSGARATRTNCGLGVRIACTTSAGFGRPSFLIGCSSGGVTPSARFQLCAEIQCGASPLVIPQ